MIRENLKILVVVAGYKPAVIYGGPVYSVSALCEELQQHDIDVTVLTTNANGQHDFPYPNRTTKWVDGVRVIYCRRIVGDPVSISPAHTWTLLKCIKEYDMIHIQGWWNWVAMISLVICKIYGVPHILSTRGALSEYTFRTQHTKRTKKWLHKLFFKRMLSSTLLHVTSNEEASKFRAVLPDAPIINIPNIVNFPAVRFEHLHHEGPLQLIFLGRIDPVKNIELLVNALRQVPFPYHLTIVGDGDPGYIAGLQQLIEQNDHITMAGPVYDERKFALLANADLLVLLSHTENFGNVILEALSQGTAVLVSKNVGAADIVSSQHLGWVITPEVEVCAETLCEINANRQQLAAIRKSGPEVLSTILSPSALASRYIHEAYGMVNPVFKLRLQIPEIA